MNSNLIWEVKKGKGKGEAFEVISEDGNGTFTIRKVSLFKDRYMPIEVKIDILQSIQKGISITEIVISQMTDDDKNEIIHYMTRQGYILDMEKQIYNPK